MIQSQRPAAADDFVLINSGVKVSSFSVLRIASKFYFGTLSASTNALKPLSPSRKVYGLAINLSEAFHGFSAFSLPFLSVGIVVSIVESRLSTQRKVF
jgi:hypothetical protein